jgi:murein DD-endopeptidase MepM/ murein hydrolase activator NlpD
MHLSEITAKNGRRLKRGDALGKAGATGRATGAHLHWGLNLFATRLDPQLLVPAMPRPE